MSVLFHNLCDKLGFEYFEQTPYTCPIKVASTKEHYWIYLYPDAEERFPILMPEPLVRSIIIRSYVDAKHSGNLLNRRSQNGITVRKQNANSMV